MAMFSCRNGESWEGLEGGRDQELASWRGRLDMVVVGGRLISLSSCRLLFSTTAWAWERGVKYSSWSYPTPSEL